MILPNTRCEPCSEAASGEHSASLYFHFATDPTAGLNRGSDNHPPPPGPHTRQEDLQVGPHAHPWHTHSRPCTSARSRPRVWGPGCLDPCCAILTLACLKRKRAGSAKRPEEAEVSRAGSAWPRLAASLQPLKQQRLS